MEMTMFTTTETVSSFSVDDLEAAKQFYGETLGLNLAENELGAIDVHLGNGSDLLIYPKSNHKPATFTVLNFVVEDVEKAVDELNARGVMTKIYADDELPDMPNDAKGIMKDENGQPALAWFKDPAGNVLAVTRVR
jgi:catechol 2,3-dioxygenase-like lactoylglutathione lyase family enzyme